MWQNIHCSAPHTWPSGLGQVLRGEGPGQTVLMLIAGYTGVLLMAVGSMMVVGLAVDWVTVTPN